MPESQIYFVSRNGQKFEEYRELLGRSDLQWSQLEVKESQSLNLELLVEEKIEEIKRTLPDARFFVEHTGLIIHAWKGLPGGLTGIFMDTVGNTGLCKMLETYRGPERRATARVVIGYHHPAHGTRTFYGEVNGSIAPAPRGPTHFGWDPIFIPEGDSRTYAEMSLEEKNRTSMRKDAAAKFRTYLASEPPARPARLFISYAHDEADLVPRFKLHLQGLERRGLIHVWSDSDITAGANWRTQIQDALEEADIFVLGVSPGFVGSEFCTGPELERVIARQRGGDALVLPVLLRAVAWEGLPFATFQVLPRNRIPIASATDHDGAFADVIQAIEDAVRKWGPPTRR